MVLKVSDITENPRYQKNREKLLRDYFLNNSPTTNNIKEEIYKLFKKEKPELSKEKLNEITENYFNKLLKIL